MAPVIVPPTKKGICRIINDLRILSKIEAPKINKMEVCSPANVSVECGLLIPGVS